MHSANFQARKNEGRISSLILDGTINESNAEFGAPCFTIDKEEKKNAE